MQKLPCFGAGLEMDKKNKQIEMGKLFEPSIFIDEAGDLGTSERSSKSIIFAAVRETPNDANRFLKRYREGVGIRSPGREIKFSNSSDFEKNTFFKRLGETDCGILCVFFPKKSIKCFQEIEDSERREFCIKQLVHHSTQHLGTIRNIEIDSGLYKKEIRSRLSEDIKSRFNINSIEHKSSGSSSGIQISDMVAGACRAHAIGNSIFLTALKKVFWVSAEDAKYVLEKGSEPVLDHGEIKVSIYKNGEKIR